MNKNTKIKVRNRSTGSVGYTIPEMGNYPRTFAARETKELPFEEIQKVSYIPGGSYLLQHYLVIENLEARDEILGGVELEYGYTEADVEKLLVYGSLDELLDCLDFAPLGVIDLVKKKAVELDLNDMKKRKAIQQKTGFSIDNAIRINEETKETGDAAAVTNGRRVQAPTEAKPAPAQERRYTVDKK
jgi:hypothetical protein